MLRFNSDLKGLFCPQWKTENLIERKVLAKLKKSHLKYNDIISILNSGELLNKKDKNSREFSDEMKNVW